MSSLVVSVKENATDLCVGVEVAQATSKKQTEVNGTQWLDNRLTEITLVIEFISRRSQLRLSPEKS